MKLPREAAGRRKPLPMSRSKVVPCLTNRVFTCAQMVLGIRVANQMSPMATKSLVSSTCVTVHGGVVVVPPSAFTAALSRNLQSKEFSRFD